MEPNDNKELERIEFLEKQRLQTLRFVVVLFAGLIALAPPVIVGTAVILFDFHYTIEEGKPPKTDISSRQLSESVVLQIAGGIGGTLSLTVTTLSRSRRFQEWIGLRAREKE